MHRFYISYTIPDARGTTKKKYLESLGYKVGAVRVVDCYTVDARLDKNQSEKAKALLANPLMQSVSTNTLAPGTFTFAIEIGYLPGVTDNIGHTAKETLAEGARLKFKPGQNVYSSQVLFISGDVTLSTAKKIAGAMHNPLIQRATITSFANFKKNGLEIVAPKVKLKGSSKIVRVDLNVSDEELIKLGKLGIPDEADKSARYAQSASSVARPFMGLRRGPLSMSLEKLQAMRDYFNAQNRKPTDIELEALAQTWSEHCKHTIFADPMDELKNGLYKTYIKAATEKIRKNKGSKDFCVSVFSDNAGGISFNQNYIIAHKVETHNTPSALDPFGGSITGIVGVNRDILGFGLGAKPIANFYGFCLADPADKTKLYRDKELTQPMLSARRIMEGVIAGINAGGNQSGIPTPLGFLYFDPRFRGKPLVFAGTLGLIPKKENGRKLWQKKAEADDLIVMVGGRVGADGIHGATFSSEGLDTHSPAGAVQIGDPITQKKFSDAISGEARQQNLYNSITDCGAGGLSSAVGEMAKESGGCEVWLDKIPLKYPGLAPWQIWISESQERMVLAVPKGKWEKFEQLMESRGVEATVIGTFTNSGNCVVKFGKLTVMDVAMDFLHNGRPQKKLVTKRSQPIHRLKQLKIKQPMNGLTTHCINLLRRLNICSTEFVSTQYDHEVQGGSIIKPLQGAGRVNGEASVIKPDPSSKKGAVLSYGLAPSYSEINPYDMAACAIDSAIAAAVAAGADVDNLALLDNFCWCSPQDPKRLYQLKEAARACYDLAVAFGTPFISGKDSMHNDFKGFDDNGQSLKISIPPTLLISALGVIPDVSKAVSLDAKLPGDLLYILGATDDELGGSEFVSMIGQTGGQVPKVNAAENLKLYQDFYLAAQENLVAGAISLGRGGLAVGLSKMLIGGGLGAEVSLMDLPGNWCSVPIHGRDRQKTPINRHATPAQNLSALFSESRGRILVSVDPKKAQRFENLITGNIFTKIGRVTKKPALIISDKTGKTIVNLKTSEALKNYKAPFKEW